MTTRYPIGGSAPIQLVGAPQGQITLSTLIGPSSDIEDFLTALASACTPISIVVTNSDTSTDEKCSSKSTPQEIICNGAVGTQIQYSLQIAEGGMAIANGTFVLQFTDMKWSSSKS